MNIFLAALLLSATHAEVVELSGSADIRANPNDDFHRAQKGEDVVEGSRVRTGEKSEIVLRFTDGSILTVSERSSMLVTRVTSQERDRSAVVLFFGKLWAKVTKQSQPAFDVATPNAVAGVRGTEFETIVGDDGEARVVVKEGRVAVSDDASEKSVDPGESVDASPDGVFAPTTKRNDEKDFNRQHRENIQKNGDKIAHAMSAKIDARKAHAQKLADRQPSKRRFAPSWCATRPSSRACASAPRAVLARSITGRICRKTRSFATAFPAPATSTTS
jgi:hypothetical protein